MQSYDSSSFDPPAPVARVTLRHPLTGEQEPDVILLMDTGSDATLLPRAAVLRLGVEPILGTRFELTAFDGSKSYAPIVELDLLFLRRAFRGEYVLVDAEQGILGRDVLNHLVILLDGPRGQWTEGAR